MNAGLINKEELVELYRSTKDERFFEAILLKNRGLLKELIIPYLNTIPKAEFNDLYQEAILAIYKGIEAFNKAAGKFSTFMRAVVVQRMNNIYTTATRGCRYNGIDDISYERLEELNGEIEEKDLHNFTTECAKFSEVDFSVFLQSLKLSEKEAVAVNVLIGGGTKTDVARAIGCTSATATYYFGKLRKKFVLAGYVF